MIATTAILTIVAAGFVPAVLAAPADPAEVVARGGGLSINDACNQQYGNQWAAAHTGNGKYDWYCVNSVTGATGSLDLNAYCARTYGSGSIAVNNNGGLYDWFCT